MTPRERFAANLRRARRRAGVSQEELGALCDLHRTEISLLERAGREPRLATMVKLASALGADLAELCAGISWQPESGRFTVEPAPAEDAGRG